MNPRHALKSGGLAAAACAACCAAPIVGALGVTAGLATVAGVFFGIAAVVVVVVLGLAAITAKVRRHGTVSSLAGPVPVAGPVRRTPTSG